MADKRSIDTTNKTLVAISLKREANQIHTDYYTECYLMCRKYSAKVLFILCQFQKQRILY